MIWKFRKRFFQLAEPVLKRGQCGRWWCWRHLLFSRRSSWWFLRWNLGGLRAKKMKKIGNVYKSINFANESLGMLLQTKTLGRKNSTNFLFLSMIQRVSSPQFSIYASFFLHKMSISIMKEAQKKRQKTK